MILSAAMSSVLTSLSPAESLIDIAVETETVRDLADRYDAQRIEKAIEHFYAVSRKRRIDPNWIVWCLREDWLPHPLFDDSTPSDTASRDRCERLMLGGRRGLVRTVGEAVDRFSPFEWEGPTAKIVREERDKWYKRLMFENPTRSNRILAEQAYALFRRGYLESDEFAEKTAM